MVSWELRLLWNSMWMKPVDASTKIQPPEKESIWDCWLNLPDDALLPYPLNFLPLVVQTKWSTNTLWPGWVWSAERIPALSLTADVVFPGTEQLVCPPNKQAAHFGSWWWGRLEALVWRCLICCEVARIPVLMMNWMALIPMWPKQWCQFKISFWGSERLWFLEWVSEMVSVKLAATWQTSECLKQVDVGRLLIELLKISISCLLLSLTVQESGLKTIVWVG